MTRYHQTRQRPSVERLESRQLLTVLPQLVVDFDKGPPRSFEQQVDNVWLGDELYFAADDGSGDVELWKSDGTPDGTVRIADIQRGIQGSLPRDFVAFDGRVLFTAYTREFGRELWSTDGTEEGTMMVSDVVPGASSSSLYLRDSAQLGGNLYYRQEQMLWATDGTSAGTQVVADIDAIHLAATDDTLFFSAASGHPKHRNGVGLYVSDGTEEGTRIIKEDSRLHQIVAVNDVVFFHADSEFLWKSNGTEEGTVAVWRTGNSAMDIVPFNDAIFFNTHYGELFYSDGTAERTQRLKSFRQMRPMHLTMVGNELFFSADERQVWKTDGTPEGTVRVANVPEAEKFRSFGETLYFQGEIKHNEPRLWKSDGTREGTRMIGLNSGTSDYQDAWVLSGNTDSVFLWSADKDAPGFWTDNHSSDDLQLLNASISGPSSGSSIGGLAQVDGNLFRRNGDDLWRIIEGEQPVRMELVSPAQPLYDAVDKALAAQRDRNRAEIGDLQFSISDGDLWVYDSSTNAIRSVTDQTPISGGCGYKQRSLSWATPSISMLATTWEIVGYGEATEPRKARRLWWHPIMAPIRSARAMESFILCKRNQRRARSSGKQTEHKVER